MQLENSLFSLPHLCLMLPSGGTPFDINAIYKLSPLKSTCNRLQYSRDNIGLSSFVQPLLAPKCEIPRKFEVIAHQAQGHRSWCQSKAHMRLPIIVINSNYGRISYCFRDIDVLNKTWKMACFPTHPLTVTQLGRNPLKFLDEIFPQKLRMGLP